VAAAETVCSWSPNSKSPYYKDFKVLYHPGEVGGPANAAGQARMGAPSALR
jgi:hypothetical protein